MAHESLLLQAVERSRHLELSDYPLRSFKHAHVQLFQPVLSLYSAHPPQLMQFTLRFAHRFELKCLIVV